MALGFESPRRNKKRRGAGELRGEEEGDLETLLGDDGRTLFIGRQYQKSKVGRCLKCCFWCWFTLLLLLVLLSATLYFLFDCKNWSCGKEAESLTIWEDRNMIGVNSTSVTPSAATTSSQTHQGSSQTPPHDIPPPPDSQLTPQLPEGVKIYDSQPRIPMRSDQPVPQFQPTNKNILVTESSVERQALRGYEEGRPEVMGSRPFTFIKWSPFMEEGGDEGPSQYEGEGRRPIRKRDTKTRPSGDYGYEGAEAGSKAEEEQLDCLLKTEGVHPHPTLGCTSIFFICVGGTSNPMSCPKGTRFEPESLSCRMRRYVKGCGGVGTTTHAESTPKEEEGKTYTTTQATTPTTRPVVPGPDCSMLAGGLFENPNQRCSDVFFTCVGTTDIQQHCPPNTFFDIHTSACQIRKYVEACGGVSLTTTRKPKQQTEQSQGPYPHTKQPQKQFVLEDDQFLCGTAVGDYPDPVSGCSPYFYSCDGVNEFGKLRKCSTGTFFDPVFKTCNFFDGVTECSGKARTTQSTPPTTTASTTTTTVPTTVWSTQRGWGWTPPPTKKGGQRRDPTVPIHPEFDCYGLEQGNYKSPKSECINEFFICDPTGTANKFHCPRLTFYDDELNQCLLWKDVPDCTGSPRTTKATTPAITTPKPPYDCTLLADGNYEAPGVSCPAFFYQCAHGQAFHTICPGNLRYHSGNDQCTTPDEVPSCPQAKKTQGFERYVLTFG